MEELSLVVVGLVIRSRKNNFAVLENHLDKK